VGSDPDGAARWVDPANNSSYRVPAGVGRSLRRSPHPLPYHDRLNDNVRVPGVRPQCWFRTPQERP
jgi:hypothetical protein